MRSITAGLLALAVPLNAAATITIKGSDTLVILNQKWAEAYRAKNPGVSIQVTGGGSGTGIAALINGSTDICAASRPMSRKEKLSLRDRFNTLGVEIPVARDGLAVYLNDSNPVKELTLRQVEQIYRGKIANWKDVGGEDAKIILYSRENNSGTYVYFKDNVLQGRDFSPMAQSLPGTAAVVNAVVKDKRGIGYGGAAYAKGIKFCPIKKTDGDAAYEPTLEHVKSGKYPISRDLYFYVRSKPSGDIKSFIGWVTGPEGQELVGQVGYFPIR
ncbi:MAG: phosphate ABC transporter substrate-binding protein [Elusimicrobia bacterium]|nr:phosphate ABC transporter substrate-binding protein [Elusimicrobiota bacterium]